MKKIVTVILTMVMVITMSFFITACEEELPTPEEVVENLVTAMDELEAYKMEMDMSMKMTADMPDEEALMGGMMNADVDMEMTGAFDNKEKKMSMVMDMNMAAPDEEPMKMAMEMYYVDGWMYAMIDIPLMSPQWMKSEVPYADVMGEMEGIDFSQSMLDMLTAAEAVVTGMETVEGMDCYVIELTPDMQKFWDMAMQQTQMTGDEMPELPVDVLEEMMRDVSVKYWIAKDTYYLVKTDMGGIIEISPEAMDMPGEEGSFTMDFDMSILMYDFDKSVSIVLPPEAEDAVEGSMW